MIRRAALALVLAAGPALAQEATLAPEAAPIPEPRPEAADEGTADPPASRTASPDGETDDRPDLIPPEDAAPAEDEAPEAPPDDLPDLIPPEQMPAATGEGSPEEAPADAPPSDDASESPAEEDGPPLREALAETPEELAACLAELDALGLAWERAEPVIDPAHRDCGMANPVTVSALAPGVALEPPSAMRCATALAAGRWVADVVVPLGGKLEGRGGVVAIAQGTAYLCRPRADGELSEHATGSALDVMGFRFTVGDPVPVEPRAGDGTMEEAFQRAVRAGACLDFSTVLGPGSDEDHADHLHLDVKLRTAAFRICD
jgi:hypothetical protein